MYILHAYFISVPPSIVDTRSSTDLVVREKEKVKTNNSATIYVSGKGEWSEIETIPVFGDMKGIRG